jgi:AraC-like DNA-binding protein
MARTPDVLAETPPALATMDALSDLLRVLRFTGGVFLEARFRAPWCLRSQVTRDDCGPGVEVAGGLVAFHYVLEGRVHLGLGKKTWSVGPGGLFLLPRNDPHRLGSDLALPPRQAEPLVRKAGDHELAQIDFGDGSRIEGHFVCGYLATAIAPHPLLEALPAALVADVGGRPSAEWVESSFRYAAREHAARRPGSQEVLARLAELLFVEAVREHIERLPGDATGWLAALRDPPLARALAALHARPAQAWTAEALAEEAFLSRSALAERFVRTLGVPPMSYLTGWRMLLAAQRLRESPDPIAQIAAAVGYESESTFSRAFSREMGVAPGAYRRGADRRSTATPT